MKKLLRFNSSSWLEIELLDNGDFLLEACRKDADTNEKTVLDMPNPVNGGGNLDSYYLIKNLYDSIK